MKLLKLFLSVLICVLCLSTGVVVYADDYEYTEEEKEAAKAWLSAHGYPPTRAGAEMAYQDYLNGKFDDDPEVARYRKENGYDTEDTEDTETTESTEDKTTEAAVDGKATTEENEASDVKVASGAGVVTDKKLGESLEENVQDKLSDPKLKMDNPSDVKLVADTREEKTKKKDFSDVLLLAGVICAVGFILFAVKAGGNKRQNNNDSDI